MILWPLQLQRICMVTLIIISDLSQIQNNIKKRIKLIIFQSFIFHNKIWNVLYISKFKAYNPCITFILGGKAYLQVFCIFSVKTFESQNNKILNSLYMLNTLNNRAKYTFCLQPHNLDLHVDYYLTPHVQPLNVRRG